MLMLFLVQYLQSIPIEHVNISKVARAITNLIQRNIYFFKNFLKIWVLANHSEGLKETELFATWSVKLELVFS